MRFKNKANPLTSVVRHIRSLADPPETSELKDSQLVQRYVRESEQAAFATLVERHGPMVLGVCRRVLRREHDAEDAFQATFLIFARKAASVRKLDSVGSFLYGVAFRLAVRAKTQAAHRRLRERQGADMRSGNQADAVTGDELWSAVDQELARLPEVDRAPLVLCYLQGKTQDTAAHHLGCSKSTFRRRLEHGLTKLRSRLRRRGVALGTGLLGVAVLQGETCAALSKELMGATARAAHLFVTSKAAAASLVSNEAIALAESGLRSMVMGKLKLAVAIVFALATIATGAGVMMRRAMPPAADETESASQLVAESSKRPASSEPAVDQTVDGNRVAIAKFGTTDLYHPGAANAMTFSPDGKILASLGQDGTVMFWNGASGKEIRKLGNPHQPAFTLGEIVFSANSKVAAALDNSVVSGVWDVETGKGLNAIQECKFSNVTAVALSADGSQMAIADNKNSIRLVDVVSGKPGPRLVGHDAAIASLAFSSDGKRLLSGGRDQLLRLWQTDTGEEQRSFEGHRDAIWAVALSPDGKMAASMSGDGTTRLWNADSGKELHRLSNPHMFAPTAAHMPCQFGFAPDGKCLVTVLSPERAIWWDVASGKQTREFEPPAALSVFIATLSPDGKSFAQVDHTGRMRLIDTAQGHDLRSSDGHRDSVLAIAISPDGKTLASGGADRAICVWDRASGRQLCRCEGHSGPVAFVGFAADGKSVISASSDSHDNNISFWDVAGGKEIRSIRKSGGAVALSPDGKILAYRSSRESLTLLDAVSGKKLRQLTVGDTIFTPLEFSQENQSLVCRGFDGPFHIYDLASGKEASVLDARRDPRLGVDSLKYMPVGDAAVVAISDGTYRLWDLAGNREVRSLGLKKPPVARTYGRFIFSDLYAVSPDARMIAVPAGNGNAIALIETATGKERQRINGHLGPIGALAFAPDGKTLISGSADGTLLTWDLNPFEREVSRKDEKLSTKELESLWTDLAGDDGEQAYRAIRTLQLSPQQTAAFLKERVHAVSDEPETPVLSADTLQALRATEVLEYLDVAESKQALERLAGGAEAAVLTREAKAALEFQARRSASKKKP